VKVTLVFVTTVDGKITKWGDPHVQKWSSKEDQEYFMQAWRNFPVVLVGSGTYDAEPITPPKKNRLIILTNNPEKYKDSQLPGHLEFTNDSPIKILSALSEQNYDQVLLAGGPHVATSFLKEGLVDELWLTLEPKIFASGGNFVVEDKLDVKLRLLSHEQVNDQGTLILKYEVMRH
jgi:dihydrofolate reductase